jgi:hypothetical protein
MRSFCSLSLVFAFLLLAGTAATAQEKENYSYKNYNRQFCSDNWSSGDRKAARDLRELKLLAGALTVDGKRNGGISVKGEDRSDIIVKACVQSWADTETDARSIVNGIRVETTGTVRAEGADGEKNWSVSYQILVPRSTDLKLTTHNGGISISDVDGSIEFEAKNGGIGLANLAGSVRGRTANGGINLRLGGNAWRGSGLDVETTNGGINVVMSESYAARVEAGTVNGGFSSDFPALRPEKSENERWGSNNKRVTADLNGGGATVRIVTTNGGVQIRSAK